jgi:hypothetical protein
VLDPSTVFDDSGPLEGPLTDEILQTVEAQLGYRLPQAYVARAAHSDRGMGPADDRLVRATAQLAVRR